MQWVCSKAQRLLDRKQINKQNFPDSKYWAELYIYNKWTVHSKDRNNGNNDHKNEHESDAVYKLETKVETYNFIYCEISFEKRKKFTHFRYKNNRSR